MNADVSRYNTDEPSAIAAEIFEHRRRHDGGTDAVGQRLDCGGGRSDPTRSNQRPRSANGRRRNKDCHQRAAVGDTYALTGPDAADHSG